MTSTKKIRIAIVAGEASGDLLGAGLIKALQQRFPQATFEGIGGPRMLALGFESFESMERLAVMGLTEVLGRVPELLRLRRRLVEYWQQQPPTVFIGIDAPDFNLGLEKKLKRSGITTIHYVSPTIWAWRQKRVFNVAESTHHVLTLFPFEAAFYEKHNIPVTFVGHPLADDIPMDMDQKTAQEKLIINKNRPTLAVLPGSRRSEVQRLAQLFMQAAKLCQRQLPDLQVLIPAANKHRFQQIQEIAQAFPDLSTKVVLGQAQDVMAASDAILLASGTATLEAMLVKRPMVVAYRVSRITHMLVSGMLKTPYVALPNLLANQLLVPELLQQQATPEHLAVAILKALHPQTASKLHDTFRQIHQQLRCNASERAADAVAKLIS
ncbi:lipid-A-disaccharide synthase [Zooshikella ganghwensis]|uniref:Lipid-A-disaccharide synthase n=1 Tax=Zooshikella ganghwensis TaxID=202772 RepID=A0A4P9VQY9_9GAMM|nr:lipid-A-disaccharide synthase [Zooshikella ganghwensis]RDH45017.1 lipid-A-disaccharide synthase [Zooshikella ganghwensis]